jgi:o-succinylbenzoate synthase
MSHPVFQVKKRTLAFHVEAGTSRGVLTKKNSYYFQISEPGKSDFVGLGEAGPLFGLSPEYKEDALEDFKKAIKRLPSELPSRISEVPDWISNIPFEQPSYRFAAEMAILDYLNQGNGIYFQSRFTGQQAPVPINGLIWMGTKDYMQQQIEAKLAEGLTCLKLKIGAIDFESELELIRSIREAHSEKEMTIRLDANGAFSSKEAASKLDRLAHFGIHSIEQPIKAGQWHEMANLCKNSAIPIALDEELIGIKDPFELLDFIQPSYIILKPSFLGGFGATMDWIKQADELKIAWWITSALESNIGLQAIAQFTGQFINLIPQGLGTGLLYSNNLASGLNTQQGNIYFDPTFPRENPFQDLSL